MPCANLVPVVLHLRLRRVRPGHVQVAQWRTNYSGVCCCRVRSTSCPVHHPSLSCCALVPTWFVLWSLHQTRLHVPIVGIRHVKKRREAVSKVAVSYCYLTCMVHACTLGVSLWAPPFPTSVVAPWRTSHAHISQTNIRLIFSEFALNGAQGGPHLEARGRSSQDGFLVAFRVNISQLGGPLWRHIFLYDSWGGGTSNIYPIKREGEGMGIPKHWAPHEWRWHLHFNPMMRVAQSKKGLGCAAW